MVKKVIIAVFAIVLIGTSSCTDLDEQVFSSVSADQFYNNETEILMAMGRAYTHLRNQTAHIWGLIGVNTIASDEGIIPYREQNLWWDQGYWIDLHRHNFYSGLWPIIDSWDYCFEGATLCNKLILQISESPVEFSGKENMIGELKILRAWFFYNAIDLWGDVPMVTDFTDLSLPGKTSRTEVFNFIVQEINDNISGLDDYSTSENYGRLNKAAAYTLLAKLYLNSEEWTGTARWEEAKQACDAVISMNHYILEPDYFSNFSPTNENSGENIWVVPFDNVVTTGWGNSFMMMNFSLHSLSTATFGFSGFTWDGLAATEAHYNLYDENDSRINSWLEGPQYSMSGEPLWITAGRQLTYRPYIHNLYEPTDPALLDDGVRVQKWMYEAGNLSWPRGMSNDWSIFRYADILLMKAEALMRANGGMATQAAVDLVNMVRERAFGNSDSNYSMASLSLEELLKERSRELAFEGHRRNDQIRFGTWSNTWKFKDAGDSHLKLYPIPFTALNANPNLSQNPGYN